MNNDQYQQLANQFIEMWQTQMQSMLTDKDFISSMMSGLQQMASFATPQPHDPNSNIRKPNTASAAAAPDDIVQLLSQLDYRLRMVETRIKALESKPTSTKSPKRPAKPSGGTSNKTVRKTPKRS